LQEDLLLCLHRAITERKPIYIGSGHSLGKDYICAAAGLWFLDTFTPSIVILTAPTDRQVQKIMWGETLNKWNKRKIPLGGKAFTSPYIEIQKDNWYLLGFTTRESGPSMESGGGKFQGFHSPNICVIASEAQAIEDNIYDQIDGITSSENVLSIFIGNPTRAKGRFAAGLRDKTNNIVFNFSCLENPNYIERKTVIPGLASYEWVEDKRKRWGEEDPRWIGRVLGQIPTQALNNTFPEWLLNHIKSRHGLLARFGENAGVAIDPAGEGVDDNVFMAGKNGEPLNIFTKTIMSPTESALKGVEMCKQVDGNFIITDCDGLGIGIYQELIRLDKQFLQGIQLIKFHGSSKSEVREIKDKPMCENLRSEAAFVAQARAKAGKASIDPLDQELFEDLGEEEFFTNGKGLLQIEPKVDIKERLGRSPGRGDAWKMLQWAFEKNFKRQKNFVNVFQGSQDNREAISEYSVLNY
jgi:hypothetical protein